MLRWGIVGAGTIGREWMAPAILAQPDSTVAAVKEHSLAIHGLETSIRDLQGKLRD